MIRMTATPNSPAAPLAAAPPSRAQDAESAAQPARARMVQMTGVGEQGRSRRQIISARPTAAQMLRTTIKALGR
ncbi:MAG: hypothetical protein BGO92_06090 [Magnetospirillum sp. 64-120]|nr:MAG: hypothetical protein BGO92_06090 [Magnetospirillum sp. 64-120]